MGQISSLTMLIALIGGLLPDVDKILWYIYQRDDLSFKQYLKWLTKDMNHKKVFACFHNVYCLFLSVTALLFTFDIFLKILYACFSLHLCFDLLDDIISIKKIKHWITLGKALG
jgi:hypothetical protein